MGTIFNIQRFCTSDGPGIRTTVFFKGCPLKCAWCHNPESQSAKRELLFYKHKCIGCDRCAGQEENEDFVCFSGAREVCGNEACAEEIINEVLHDMPFYKNSGGGITLSGGEPLYQLDFAIQLLKMAKNHGIHTAIETCGFAPSEHIKTIAEYTDLFLFDIKETDAERHKEFTGVDNALIIENLNLIDSLGKKIVLRCPVIPDCNDRDEHFEGIAALANSLKNVLRIEVEPYHPLGEGKSEALGRKVQSFKIPSAEEVERYVSKIREKTSVEVVRA